MDQKPTLKAWGLLILLSLIWGSSFILIKKGLIALSATEVGALRIFSASLVMMPVALVKWKDIQRAQIKYLIIVGLSGSLVPAFLFAIAQTKTTSSVTGVINALTPIFTLLIGLFFYRQKANANIWWGILIGFSGAMTLVLSGAGTPASFNFYALLIVLATVLYAINLNVIKFHLQGLRSLTITSVSLLFVGPISGLFLWFFTDLSDRLHEEEVRLSIFYIVLLGLFGTAIALIIFNKIVQLTSTVFTSSVTYIIPIVAIFWGLLDGELLGLAEWVGVLLILCGVYLTNRVVSLHRVKAKKG